MSRIEKNSATDKVNILINTCKKIVPVKICVVDIVLIILMTSEAYLEPCRRSTMELFWRKQLKVKGKKAPSQMLDRVLNTFSDFFNPFMPRVKEAPNFGKIWKKPTLSGKTIIFVQSSLFKQSFGMPFIQSLSFQFLLCLLIYLFLMYFRQPPCCIQLLSLFLNLGHSELY